MSKNTTKNDENQLKEREFMIKNCLNSQCIGSDGDITSHDITEKIQDSNRPLGYIDGDL
jgi:hypothetical protein